MTASTLSADAAYWNARARDNEGDPQSMVGWASHPFDAHQNYVKFLLTGIVKPGSRVLDVGCGFGRFAQFVVEELKAEWVGVDYSEEMRRVWEEESGFGTFILADARQPQSDWGRFSTILAVGSNQQMGLNVGQFAEVYTPLIKRTGHIVIVGPYTTTINNLF